MGIGTRSFRVECKTYHCRLYPSEKLEYRLNVPFTVRLLGKDIASIEAKTEMFNILHRYAVMRPYELLFKLSQHTLKPLYIRRVLFTAVTFIDEVNILLYLANQLIF